MKKYDKSSDRPFENGLLYLHSVIPNWAIQEKQWSVLSMRGTFQSTLLFSFNEQSFISDPLIRTMARWNKNKETHCLAFSLSFVLFSLLSTFGIVSIQHLLDSLHPQEHALPRTCSLSGQCASYSNQIYSQHLPHLHGAALILEGSKISYWTKTDYNQHTSLHPETVHSTQAQKALLSLAYITPQRQIKLPFFAGAPS